MLRRKESRAQELQDLPVNDSTNRSQHESKSNMEDIALGKQRSREKDGKHRMYSDMVIVLYLISAPVNKLIERTIVQRMDSAMNYNTFWLFVGFGFVSVIVVILWHIDFISTYSDDLRTTDTSNLSDVTKRLHKQIVFDFNKNFNANERPVKSWMKDMLVDDEVEDIADRSLSNDESTFTIPLSCTRSVSEHVDICDINAGVHNSPTLVGVATIASFIDSLSSRGFSMALDSSAVYHIAEDFFISEGTMTITDKRKGKDNIKTVFTLTKFTLQRKTNLIKDIHVYVSRGR